jgi:hypothetical protein
MFRKKDKYENSRYFSEVYIDPLDIPAFKKEPKEKELTLRDINKALMRKTPTYDIEGLINVNDLLVKKGLADYADFSKPPMIPPRVDHG